MQTIHCGKNSLFDRCETIFYVSWPSIFGCYRKFVNTQVQPTSSSLKYFNTTTSTWSKCWPACRGVPRGEKGHIALGHQKIPTMCNAVHLLPEDLMLLYGGAKVVS